MIMNDMNVLIFVTLFFILCVFVDLGGDLLHTIALAEINKGVLK